jgi:CHASE1-domain containing sensor protein
MSDIDKEAKTAGLSGLLIGRSLARGDLPASSRKAELGKLQGYTSAVASLLLASLKAVLAAIAASIAVASCDFESKADQAAAFIKQRVAGIGRLQIGIETSYASDPEYRKRYPE